MDSTLNGINPEWTQPQKDSTPTGTQPRIDSTPTRTQPRKDSTLKGLNPERTELRMGLNLEFLFTSKGTISLSKYKHFTIFFDHESKYTDRKIIDVKR
jgi:hypothetical protein